MKTIVAVAAFLGIVSLGACKAPDTVGRFDGGLSPISTMSAAQPEELHQSLAAVSMKNDLPAGAALEISERARAIIAAHAGY